MAKSKQAGIILILLAIALVAGVAYNKSVRRHIPVVFSPKEMMNSIWVRYKTEYLEPETYRTLDKQRENITTSEGQSYTMLRAVWMDDKETFDRSWKWTKDNLWRDEDRLFAWLFGETSTGQYGIITEQGGNNTATDGDTDIALALVFAYGRWKDEVYMGEALSIIRDVWEKEVITINGKPYLVANNLEKTEDKDHAIVNPSYFSPYAYKIFAELDPAHPWNELVDTSYEVLEKSIDMKLDKEQSAGLPPNWIALDKQTAEIRATGVENLNTDYSYDALRVPWRLALDWQWNNEPRAKNVLSKMRFIENEWDKNEAIYTYTHDGTVISQDEVPALYGGNIGYFIVMDPAKAEDVYLKKLQFLYTPDKQNWKQTLSYYDDNWAWFGIALYNRALPNLSP